MRAQSENAADFMGRAEGFAEVDLWQDSPIRLSWPPEQGWRDATAMLRAMFAPEESVCCGGGNRWAVRTREAWCGRFRRGVSIPPLVMANPVAGGEVWPEAAKVAGFRHCVVEVDGLDFEEQVRFWVGSGMRKAMAASVAVGGGLAVVLRVEAGDGEEWLRRTADMHRRIFGGAARVANLHPGETLALAGAVHPTTGERQRLVFAGLELAGTDAATDAERDEGRTR